MARGLSKGFDGCDGLGDKGIVHAVHVHGFADSSGKRDAEASAEVFAEIAEAAQYLQFAVGPSHFKFRKIDGEPQFFDQRNYPVCIGPAEESREVRVHGVDGHADSNALTVVDGMTREDFESVSCPGKFWGLSPKLSLRKFWGLSPKLSLRRGDGCGRVEEVEGGAV